MLEQLKNGKCTVGVKQSLKALQKHEVKCIFIAKDADARIVEPIKAMGETNGIEIVYIENMKQLGKACSIEVGAAVACLLH